MTRRSGSADLPLHGGYVPKWFADPPGLPATLADKINRGTDEVLQKSEIIAKLRALQLEPMGGSAANAATFIAGGTQLWGKVIKDIHTTLH